MKKTILILFIAFSCIAKSDAQTSIRDSIELTTNQKIIETRINYLEDKNKDLKNQILKQGEDMKDDLANIKKDFNGRLNIYVLFITLILSMIAVAINFFGKAAIKARVEDIIQKTAENYAESKTNEVLSKKITDEYISKIIRESGEAEIKRLLDELEQRGQKTIDDIKNRGDKVIDSVLAEPPNKEETEKKSKLTSNELFKLAFESKNPLLQTDFYKKVLELEPGNRNALNNIAVALYHQNKFHEAIEYLNKSIELYPTYGLAYANRAHCFNQLGNIEQAFNDVDRAIELNPNLEWAYSIKGNLLTKQNKFEEAEKQLQKAVDINPNSPHAYFNRAYFKEETGKYEESANDYKKAQELGFDQETLLYNNLAVLSRRLGKFDEALEYLEKVKEINPEFPNLYGTMALVYADKSDDDNFYKFLKMALEKGCLVWNYLNDPGFDNYRDSQKLKDLMMPYQKNTMPNIG